MLLADRDDDRTHFIFELLQNAEDALSRRHGWRGSRAVTSESSPAAYAEIAFKLGKADGKDSLSVEPVRDCPLVVFFPTILPQVERCAESHLPKSAQRK